MFPCARAVVRWRGRHRVQPGAWAAATVFDLASLTKLLATTAVFLSPVGRRQARARHLAGPRLPGVARRPGRGHRGRPALTTARGLPAFVPFFARALTDEPRLLDADCPPAVRVARPARTSSSRPLATDAGRAAPDAGRSTATWASSCSASCSPRRRRVRSTPSSTRARRRAARAHRALPAAHRLPAAGRPGAGAHRDAHAPARAGPGPGGAVGRPAGRASRGPARSTTTTPG